MIPKRKRRLGGGKDGDTRRDFVGVEGSVEFPSSSSSCSNGLVTVG